MRSNHELFGWLSFAALSIGVAGCNGGPQKAGDACVVAEDQCPEGLGCNSDGTDSGNGVCVTLIKEGEACDPKADLGKFAGNEMRFRLVEQQDPERFRALLARGQSDITRHFARYEAWAHKPGAPAPEPR